MLSTRLVALLLVSVYIPVKMGSGYVQKWMLSKKMALLAVHVSHPAAPVPLPLHHITLAQTHADTHADTRTCCHTLCGHAYLLICKVHLPNFQQLRQQGVKKKKKKVK